MFGFSYFFSFRGFFFLLYMIKFDGYFGYLKSRIKKKIKKYRTKVFTLVNDIYKYSIKIR